MTFYRWRVSWGCKLNAIPCWRPLSHCPKIIHSHCWLIKCRQWILFSWQDVSVYENKQRRGRQTSEGHADSCSAGLSIIHPHIHVHVQWDDCLSCCGITASDGGALTPSYEPGVLERAHGEETLVRRQRRLHCDSAGQTFHHRPVVCHRELHSPQTITSLAPFCIPISWVIFTVDWVVCYFPSVLQWSLMENFFFFFPYKHE